MPCSATSTTRSVPSGMRATPRWPSAPKRIGSPCSSRITASSRVSGDFSSSKAPSLKMLQFW